MMAALPWWWLDCNLKHDYSHTKLSLTETRLKRPKPEGEILQHPLGVKLSGKLLMATAEVSNPSVLLSKCTRRLHQHPHALKGTAHRQHITWLWPRNAHYINCKWYGQDKQKELSRSITEIADVQEAFCLTLSSTELFPN